MHQKRKRKKKKEKKEAALHLRAISQYILYSLGGTPADKTITLHHFSYQLTSRWYLSAQGKIYMRNPDSEQCPPHVAEKDTQIFSAMTSNGTAVSKQSDVHPQLH